MYLKFELNDDGLECLNPAVAAASVEVSYVKAHFDITNEAWDDVDAIVAVFKSATFNVTSEVLLDSNYSCYVDSTVWANGGTIQVTLYGDQYSDSEVVSTTHVSDVCEVVFNNNITLPTAIPSVYQVVLAELETVSSDVQDFVSNVQAMVDNGDFDGVGISQISFDEEGYVTVTLTDGNTYTSSESFKGEQGDPGADAPYITTITYGEDGYVVITMSDGTYFTSDYSMKGEKGDTGNGISAIWFDENNRLHIELDDGQSAESESVTETVSVNAFLISYDKATTTSSSSIELDMAGYEYDSTDIIFVFINGLIGIPTTDYTVTVSDDVASINLTMDSPSNESVFIRVIKARADFGLLLDSYGYSILDSDDNNILI